MAYNRIGNCKFYMDAALIARQWGQIETENIDNKFHLNPSNITTVEFQTDGADYYTLFFKNRYWLNSITHLFVLGHNFNTHNVGMICSLRNSADNDTKYPMGSIPISFDMDGWHKFNGTSFSQILDVDLNMIHIRLNGETGATKIGDFSLGWSFEMPHSPDLELTQTFSNESISVQTTKSGHTLTNSGYNKKADCIRPAWAKSTTDTPLDDLGYFQGGRRSWSLKFSFVSDTDLFAEKFTDDTNGNFGIFEHNGSGDYQIKDNFIDKVFHGTNSFQLPFIFQPNKDVEEYAMCRINNDSASFTQTANNIYDISLNLSEIW